MLSCDGIRNRKSGVSSRVFESLIALTWDHGSPLTIPVVSVLFGDTDEGIVVGYLLAGGELAVYILFTYFDLTLFSANSSDKSPTPGRWLPRAFLCECAGVLLVLFLITNILYF